MSLCKLGDILAICSTAERDALQHALSQRDEQGRFVWSAERLSNAVCSTDSYSVGATVVKQHRRRECVCYAH